MRIAVSPSRVVAPPPEDRSRHRPRVRILLPLLFAALFGAPAALATPPSPVGPEIPLAEGEGASVAVLADGGFAVAWRTRIDFDNGTVWLRLFAPDGNPVGPARLVGGDRRSRFFQHQRPAIGAAADGSLVVAWIGPGNHVHSTAQVRRFTPSGQPIDPASRVSGGLEAFDVELAVAPDGGFVVAWTGLTDGRNPDVYARRFLPSGSPAGPRFLLHGDTSKDQYLGGLALAPDGRLFAVVDSWEGEGNFLDVQLSGFAADDSPLVLDVPVNIDPDLFGASQAESSIVLLSDGRWLVVFTSPAGHPDGSVSRTVFGRLVDPDGTPLAIERVLAEGVGGRQSEPVAAATRDGGFVVLWRDECEWEFSPHGHCDAPENHRDGSFAGVWGRAFDAAGEAAGDDFLLPIQTTERQIFPALAAGPNGDLVATWTQAAPDHLEGSTVVGRRLAAPCEPAATTLCLGGGRFRADVEWHDFFGNRGEGIARADDDLWGTFWFFDAANLELAVKLIDGRSANGHYWVFFGSLSNVEYTLRVTDTASGRVATYHNPSGTFASRGDTAAFEEVTEVGADATVTPGSAAPARPAGGAAAVRGRRAAAAAEGGTCQPAADRLCLVDGRYAVEVAWSESVGDSGRGMRLPLTDDTGAFWFFRDDNPEIVVKVLDARTVNGHVWVFFASLTDVGFELEVTDTASGERRVYVNPPDTFASRGDTAAFPATDDP